MVFSADSRIYPGEWQKIAFYAVDIADADLDMVFFAESRRRIKWIPLPKYTTNRIEFFIADIFH